MNHLKITAFAVVTAGLAGCVDMGARAMMA